MKKSQILQLSTIIEMIVAKELKKQLPKLLSEIVHTSPNNNNNNNNIEKNINSSPKTTITTTTSLKELMDRDDFEEINNNNNNNSHKKIQFTKNEVLNELLNNTKSDLRYRERMVGYQSYVNNNQSVEMAQVDDSELGFMKNVPIMGNDILSKNINIPIGTPPTLIEGQHSNHAPLSTLPEGVSVLDIAKSGAVNDKMSGILTRNYSELVKAMDKNKNKNK